MLDRDQSAHLLFLAECIARRDVTQQDVAKATGVHQSQISRILGGRARRPSKNVLRLCKYAETLGARKADATARDVEIISALKSLLGRSAEEDQRLLDVVASLSAWRACWGTKP